MKLHKLLALAGTVVALAFSTACSTTPGQNAVIIQTGAGEAVGTNLLKHSEVNGLVPPAYLAQYEAEIPNVAGLMQNKITPADLGKILNAEGATSGLSADKLSVVGLLNGATDTWIKFNQGTPEGTLVDAAAKNFAVGLGNAVGLVTGTNYIPPVTAFENLTIPSTRAVAFDAMPYQSFGR